MHLISGFRLTDRLAHAQSPLRANGTDIESLYRQMLAQFTNPLATDGKRSLWLDPEYAIKLKGSIVLAHHPELWLGIGEGLKPRLVRGIRIVSPQTELNSQGINGLQRFLLSFFPLSYLNLLVPFLSFL